MRERFNERLRNASAAVMNAQRSGGKLSVEEAQQRLDSIFEEADESLEEFLLPSQWKRLRSVFVRRMGPNVVMVKWIQQEIGLTKRQDEKIKKLRHDAAKSLQAEIKELVDAGRRKETRELIIKRNKSIEKKMLAILEGGQLERLRELEGSHFTLDK